MARPAGDNMRKGRPERTRLLIGVWLQPDQLAGLDAWINTRAGDGLSRPEAIHRLIEEGLKSKGQRNGSEPHG